MPPARTPAPTLADRLALPAILALAVALRVREALRAPLWFDELYTRTATDRPWADMLRVMHADVHPPLHFAYLWAWRSLGDSDLVVRSSSLVCALGALLLTYVLARAWFGRTVALTTTLLLALHPWHVYMSQEARSYPLLWLGLTLSTLGAWRWCEEGRRRDAALFLLGGALALWTHYLAAVVLLAQALWGLARLARTPRRAGQWVLLHVALGAMFAPLLPLLWSQMHRVQEHHWLHRPHLLELVDAARRLAFGSSLLAAPLFALALWPLADHKARRAAACALAVGPLAVVLCWLMGTQGIRVFSFKYMMFALPALYALVCAGALRLPGRWAPALALAALVAFAGHALALQPPYAEAGSLGQVRPWLAARLRAGDTVFHSDTHTWLFGRRYFPQARHRLLAMGQDVPYFEGAAVIPDSVLGTAGELRGQRTRRWFALSWGKGGMDGRAFAALADSCAGAPVESLGLVRAWSGTR